jgi:Tfp pilus assembly protein PilX
VAKLNSRDGFALPMALIVMIVLTAGIAAGFAATSAEITSNAAHRSDNRAYNMAEAGLETFLNERKTAGFCSLANSSGASTGGVVSSGVCLADPADPLADSEWTRVQLTGGYANVTSVNVRNFISDALPALFFIRSVGVDSSIKLSGGTSTVFSTRAVGMMAAWTKQVVQVEGAWMALSGLDKHGNSGVISGVDYCPSASGGGKPTVAGAVVPNGGLFMGQTPAFSGSPALDTTRTFAQIKASTKLDWAGIVAGAIPADFDVPPASFPTAAWFTSNPNAWPVIHVHSSTFTLPAPGQGMIIADNDFTISGSNMWNGIVLVGGSLTSNGNNTTSGATFSGLNFLLGGTPTISTDSSSANGTKTYVYNSCNVEKAASGLRIYKPWNNTWLDNVPVW